MTKQLTITDDDGNIQTWDDLKDLIIEDHGFLDVANLTDEEKLKLMKSFIEPGF